MKIAVIANLKEEAPIEPEDPPGRWDDLDDEETIEAILNSLKELGHEAKYFPGTLQSIAQLQEFQPHLCFNSAEGYYGDSREAQVPAILDMMRLKYTCAGVLGMSLAHNKVMAKKIFRGARIPTADFVVVRDGTRIPKNNLRFPLFVKPALEGSSIGINAAAVVYDQTQLEQQVNWVRSRVDSMILIEEYIEGREFTIGILGDEVLPIVEIVSPTGFYSAEQKEDFNSAVYRVCPAQIEAEKTSQLKRLALRAKQVLELHDVCRMDLRMDQFGRPYVLEVNPIPLMYPDPKQASLIYAAFAAGYTYTDVVRKIIESASQRYRLM